MAKASKKLDILPFFLLVLAGLCFFKEVSIDMPHFFLKYISKLSVYPKQNRIFI